MKAEGTDKPIGLLAKSWDHNENFTVWTFYLRDGIKFQDGTAFNASAVKYTFDRGVLVNYPDGPWAAVLTSFLKNGPEWLASNNTQADADKYLADDPVKVINETTVQITLAKPFPEFDKVMAFSATAILSPTFDKANGGYTINSYDNTSALKEKMCGTGPFTFGSWKHEDRITLNKNPSYWGTAAKPDTVIIKTVPDLTTRLQAIDKGDADISIGENAKNIPQIKNITNGKMFVFNDSWTIDFFGFYQGKKPFDDKSVRKAFIEAFDTQTYKNTVVYGFGRRPRMAAYPRVLWATTRLSRSPNTT